MITQHAASLWTGMVPALANHLWQSTVFGVAVWGMTLLLHNNQAQVRYRLWLAASVKFLIPFSLLISLGAVLPKPQLSVKGPRVYEAVDAAAYPFSRIEPPSVPSTFSVGHPRERFAVYVPVLGALWLCGAMAVLCVWCVRWRQVATSERMATPVESGREVDILCRLQNPAKPLHIRIVLRRSQQPMEPGIFGIFRPVLLWPERLSEQLDDMQLEAVLTHEVMHARRRDNLTAMIHMFIETAFWFHPMVWWIEGRMKEERERACDEATVLCGGRPDVYAESLLKACRFCIESPLTCVSGVAGANLSRRILSIMTLRPEQLSRSRKLALCALGLVAALGPVAFGVMRRVPVHLQTQQTAGARPSFEVATIKPSKPDEVQNLMMGTRDGYYNVHHMSLKQLIKFGYQVTADDQLIGATDWMDKEYFDIEAKAAEPEIQSMRRLGVAGSMEQFRLMLQSLLEDRFQLKVASRMRELSVYALVVARGGPKLRQVAASPELASADIPPPPAPPPPPPPPPGGGAAPPPQLPPRPASGIEKTGRNQVTATAWRMSWLANWLQHQGEIGDRVVVDQTDLRDSYDFVLNGIQTEPSGATPAPPDDSTVSVFTALQEQLGLKLIPAKAPVEVLIVVHAERPSAN
jgi:bla regulator protein blaR1